MSEYDTATFALGSKSMSDDLMSYSDVQWVYLNSIAQGSPNNSIQWNRPQSSDWIYWPSGFVMIPVSISTLTATTLAATSSINAPLSIGLKPAGTLSLIDKVNVQLNGRSFSQVATLHSVWMHLRNIFKYSRNYLELVGASMFKGRSMPALEVNHYYNNQTAAATLVVTQDQGHVTPALDRTEFNSLRSPLAYNRVLYERCMQAAFPSGLITQTTAATAGSLSNQNAAVNNTAVVQNVRQSRYLPSASNPAAGGVGGSYYLYCPIPLVELSDIFANLGLARNLGLNLTVFVNNCSGVGAPQSAAVTAAGSVYAHQNSTNGTFRNSSCPIMITDVGAATEGTGAATYDQGNISTATVQIGYDTGSVAFSELWLPICSPTPEQEKVLLANSERVVEYDDFVLQTASALAATASISLTPFASINSPKKLYILQFVDASAVTSACQPEFSVTSCAPYYSDAFQGLYNITVKVNNTPISNIVEQYNYQDFWKNVLPQSGIQAGLDCRLAAGLVSSDFWNMSKVFVFDLTRYCPSGVTVQLSVNASNNSNYASKLLFFVEQRFQTKVVMSAEKSDILTPQNI